MERASIDPASLMVDARSRPHVRLQRALAIAALLVTPGCLGTPGGLDIVVVNPTDAGVTGTLTLRQGNSTVEHRAFSMSANETLVVEDLTRANGRYDILVQLDDGRAANATVQLGGRYYAPQVTIQVTGITIQQRYGTPPRGGG